MENTQATQLSRIQESLRQLLAKNVLHGSQKLPSERALSVLFSTTRITLKEALSALEIEGVIYRESRRGWFVCPARLIYNPLSRCHFHQLVNDQQRNAKTQVLAVHTQFADAQQSKLLGLAKRSEIYCIERLRYVDNRPVLYVQNCLISALFPNILKQDLSQSLTQLYQQQYGYQTLRSRFEVTLCGANKQVADALHLAQGQQVLKICRVNYQQQGTIIDCEFEYWRPDAVIITIDSHEG
ncbi:MFS transporter [Psychromonas sp. MB-3u-54]|uniref:UTRA domain-containing protein n=1 Tax=Psychromonas sp. MB-3u-54 TaxID=2058319 RepID=UPI000C325809|nr:UTRA domain-containing protein [Psychromonas sp. MB-3u-54]PKH02175.1 MFS transporter [Psychromonas sp. MB-3u-54]